MTAATFTANTESAEFNEERKDLSQEYLNLLLAATVPLLVITILRAAAWRTAPGLFYSWPVAITLGIGMAMAYSWRRQRPRIASWTYILSLILANTLEMYYFPASPAPYLFAVIAVSASLLLSETGAIVADALALAALGFAASSFGWLDHIGAILQAALIIVLTGFVSWLGTRQLYTVLRWEWHSTRQAIEETRKAQNHRAEMMHLNKELDGAYTRLESMNRMLILARKEAEEARMLKVQFANAVSHELRSPLNMIIGFSDMMVNSPEVYGAQPWPPRLKSHVQQIYQSSQHLSQLVDDVLDLARIDAYRMALNKQRASIEEVITEAVDITRTLYEARKLYLKVVMEPDLPTVLYDLTRMRQVMLNFLSNALRFTRQGGVTIHATRQDKEVVVSVIDTGSGIASEDLPKLFQEFTQVGGSIYRQGQGFGLGLAISKQLVELHGGRTLVESAPGKGSVFSFTLPIDPSYVAEDIRDTARDEAFWNRLEQDATERKSVLVCAPESVARRLVAAHLTSYDIAWACSDDELEQAVATRPPSAVVRIEQHGNDAQARIAAQACALRLHGVPLINCSLPGLVRKPSPRVSQLSDYLVKPISRRKLLDALRKLGRDFSRVLIIDDEPAMREFLTLCISSAYPRSAIRAADCGEHALHYVRELSPDLILLDLALPDVDGLDLAEQLRQINHEQASIVAVTARDYPVEEDKEECDEISYWRAGHFSQRELERVLNVLLETVSPSRAPAGNGFAANGFAANGLAANGLAANGLAAKIE